MSAYDNNPNLPSPKVDPLVITAAEFNALVTAVADLRAAFLGAAPSEGGPANFLALAQNGSPPNSAAGKVNLFTDGNLLMADVNGAGTQICSPMWANVKDPRFAGGAKGDGVTDDSPAFAAALAYLLTQQQIYSGTTGFQSYTGKMGFYLPGGIYMITETLPFIGIRSDQGAVIVMSDSTKDVFSNYTTFLIDISGIQVRGGRDAIHVDNNHVSGLNIHVTDCTFADQVRSVFDFEAGAQSSMMTVRRCNFYAGANPTSLILRGLGVDAFYLKDCMCQGFTSDVFMLGSIADNSAGVMEIENFFASPGAPAVAGSAWINLQSGQVRCRNFRFGGEPGMKAMLRNYQGGRVDIQTSDTYAPTGDWNYKFHGIPFITKIRDNFGQGLGMWFDPGQAWAPNTVYNLGDVVQANGNSYQCLVGGTSLDCGLGPSGTGLSITDNEIIWSYLWPGTSYRDFTFQSLGGLSWMDVEGFNGEPASANGQSGSIAGGDPLQTYRAKVQLEQRRTCEPMLSDLISRIFPGRTDLTPNGSATNITTSNVTNEFGAGQLQVTTSGAGNGNYAQQWLTALVGLPDDVYTATFDVTVSAAQAYVTLIAGDQKRNMLLEQGRHLLHMPFTLAATMQGSFGVGYGVIVQNSATATFGPVDIWRGRVIRSSGQKLRVIGAAAPIRGIWYQGDEVEYPQPVSSNFRGLVCTTPGVVGSVWAGATHYNVGDQVTNGGFEAYVCRVAGKSAASPGPSGTGSGIIDGGVTWDALGNPLAVFKTWGAVS